MTSKSQKHPEDETEDLGELEKEEPEVPPAEAPPPEPDPKADVQKPDATGPWGRDS